MFIDPYLFDVYLFGEEEFEKRLILKSAGLRNTKEQ